MRRRSIFIFLVFAGNVAAYEASMPNLHVPSTLTPITLEIDIQHRFGRALTDQRISDFFGGANTSSKIRVAAWRGLEAYGDYATSGHAFSGGLGYSRAFEKALIRLRGDVQYFSFEPSPRKNRAGNFFYMVSVQSSPLFNHLSISINTGYDAYNKHPGIGATMLVKIAEIVDLFGELSPLVGSSDAPAKGRRASYSGGVKINTDGHHFKLIISNSTGIGPRLFMLGAPSYAPHFGFSIERLFRFNHPSE